MLTRKNKWNIVVFLSERNRGVIDKGGMMREVYPNLFVGNQLDYENLVAGQSGWMILHACKEPYHRQALGYSGRAAPRNHPEYLVARRGNRLILNMVDVDNPDFFDKGMIETGLNFIDEALKAKKRILVHCNLGESRSPSIVLLYMASRIKILSCETLQIAELEFVKKYPEYNPKPGIRGFLSKNWNYFCKLNN